MRGLCSLFCKVSELCHQGKQGALPSCQSRQARLAFAGIDAKARSRPLGSRLAYSTRELRGRFTKGFARQSSEAAFLWTGCSSADRSVEMMVEPGLVFWQASGAGAARQVFAAKAGPRSVNSGGVRREIGGRVAVTGFCFFPGSSGQWPSSSHACASPFESGRHGWQDR